MASTQSVHSCISFVSYIKPQLLNYLARKIWVVYRSFPTSNHNPIISNKLYINILLILFIVKNGRVGFVYRKNTKKTPTEQVR